MTNSGLKDMCVSCLLNKKSNSRHSQGWFIRLLLSLSSATLSSLPGVIGYHSSRYLILMKQNSKNKARESIPTRNGGGLFFLVLFSLRRKKIYFLEAPTDFLHVIGQN